MKLSEYQAVAQETDQNPESNDRGKTIAFLGLVGEAGSLLAEYKKQLRDGGAHKRFEQQLAEELGDLLWYISNIATKFGLRLEDIAARNIAKVKDRWVGPGGVPATLDDDAPPEQQLPRRFCYTLRAEDVGGVRKTVMRDEDGEMVGDPLTDNAHERDGYSFHDVLHLALAAKLGWSPVLRKLLGRKRKYNPNIDEVEDGARAAAIEEALATGIAEYALRHNYLEGTERVDWDLLRFARRMTEGLEVRVRTEKEWEDAIVAGIKLWKQLIDAEGGMVCADLYRRTIEIRMV